VKAEPVLKSKALISLLNRKVEKTLLLVGVGKAGEARAFCSFYGIKIFIHATGEMDRMVDEMSIAMGDGNISSSWPLMVGLLSGTTPDLVFVCGDSEVSLAELDATFPNSVIAGWCTVKCFREKGKEVPYGLVRDGNAMMMTRNCLGCGKMVLTGWNCEGCQMENKRKGIYE
jgi:hypothetical protein